MSSTRIDSNWALVHDRLIEKMSRVRDEISHYPAPIPACDAQFNHLLEARDALSTEIARVRELMGQNNPEGERRSIEAFLDSSKGLDSAAIAEIRTLIENENP